MTYAFDQRDGLVIVLVELQGPSGLRTTRLALDTGATFTVIRPNTLQALGYDREAVSGSQLIATANGPVTVPVVRVAALTALDHTRRELRILSHAVPSVSGIHGLLGLDFFRGMRLTIDFRMGEITLE